jgi:hypothetical protein
MIAALLVQFLDQRRTESGLQAHPPILLPAEVRDTPDQIFPQDVEFQSAMVFVYPLSALEACG